MDVIKARCAIGGTVRESLFSFYFHIWNVGLKSLAVGRARLTFLPWTLRVGKPHHLMIYIDVDAHVYCKLDKHMCTKKHVVFDLIGTSNKTLTILL